MDAASSKTPSSDTGRDCEAGARHAGRSGEGAKTGTCWRTSQAGVAERSGRGTSGCGTVDYCHFGEHGKSENIGSSHSEGVGWVGSRDSLKREPGATISDSSACGDSPKSRKGGTPHTGKLHGALRGESRHSRRQWLPGSEQNPRLVGFAVTLQVDR
jgi:hypothetical protein